MIGIMTRCKGFKKSGDWGVIKMEIRNEIEENGAYVLFNE
jgi:hypothetical protein